MCSQRRSATRPKLPFGLPFWLPGWKAEIGKARGKLPDPKATFWDPLRQDFINAQDEGQQLAAQDQIEEALLMKEAMGFGPGYVFHSIRKTVATQLEQAGVAEGVAADILGHERKTLSYGLYSTGSSTKEKLKAVSKVAYTASLERP